MTKKRPDFSGKVLHAMNRRVDRQTLFCTDEDYALFRSLMSEAVYKFNLRILEWVLMPNHWHMLIFPETKNQVSEFMHWLCGIHAKKWRAEKDNEGNGALYQDRFKAFLVKPGLHVDRLRNYLAMNPVKANLVDNPFDWIWGSAKRVHRDCLISTIPISKGPPPSPSDLKELLSTPLNLTETQIDRLEKSFLKGLPYGDDVWTEQMIEEYHLEHTLRKAGRPKSTAG